MNLVHFRGLNCYFDCVVSIAAALGLTYADSFATLWSETDFTYDRRLKAYSSKRILKNLEAMGARFDCVGCASIREARKILAPCEAGELIIVGMDAYAIPWSPIYQVLHDPHYFVARKEGPDSFVCFDPTYDKKSMEATHALIVAHAFDICRIQRVAKKPLPAGVVEEMREIPNSHPQTKERLLVEINQCVQKRQKCAALLAKYVDAMINNRYLFARCLQSLPCAPDASWQPFDKALFSRWEAVKNGLYKASLIKQNQGVLHELCELVDALMRDEIAMAKQLRLRFVGD